MFNLKNHQKHILITYSADYKYNKIINSIDYFKNKIDRGDFLFFNINSNIEDVYNKWNVSYNYLEKQLIKISEKDNHNIYGYNLKLVEALLYNPPDEYIFHTDIYNYIDDIYKNYFSNLYDFEQYNIINTYKVDTFLPSNYLKVCYDSDLADYDHLPNVTFFYYYPLYFLSKSLIRQISTSINRDIYVSLQSFDIRTSLHIGTIDGLNKTISDFIINNIFGDTGFNEFYITEIEESVDLSNLSNLFNTFINDTVPLNDMIRLSSTIFSEYVYDFMYNLYINAPSMGVDFSPISNIKDLVTKQIQEGLKKIKHIREYKSIITISYKYREDPLQFINSTLLGFDLWLDLIIQSQQTDVVFDHYLSTNDIHQIIRSITIDNSTFIDYVENNYKNDLVSSKTIDICIYSYVEKIVSRFINSDVFKNYIIDDIIPDIADALRTRSPRLYVEIYENIDKIKMYIKFILINHIMNTSDLTISYRDILNTATADYNFDDFYLDNIVSNFYNIPDSNIKAIQKEYSKFITSMIYLIFFDNYIDRFRLIKKYKEIKPKSGIVESEYR